MSGNDPNVERYDPDLWTDEFAFLNQPGQAEIQSDLFYDYRTNVDAYPKWQAWMREKQPRLLVLWGKYDLFRASRSRRPIAATCRRPKSTFSMRAISRSTPRQTRSRHWSGALSALHEPPSVLHAEVLRRGALFGPAIGTRLRRTTKAAYLGCGRPVPVLNDCSFLHYGSIFRSIGEYFLSFSIFATMQQRKKSGLCNPLSCEEMVGGARI